MLNIVHTVALVLPTIVISMLDSGIAHTIDQTSQRYELQEETSQTSEERRNFNGLVLDWYVAHGFAIVAIIAMIIFNIYAWIVINNYRQVGREKIFLFSPTTICFQEIFIFPPNLRRMQKFPQNPRRQNFGEN